MTQGGLVQQIPLLRLAAGVANHARGAAHQRYGTVAAPLEVFENHNTHQVSYMERIGRRVDTQIGSGHLFVQLLFGSGHHVVNHASPLKFFYKIHRLIILFID